MLDLDRSEEYPQFIVKYQEKEYKFDPLRWGEQLGELDTSISNVEQVLTEIATLTGFKELTGLQAFAIIAEFYKFIKTDFDDAVKNILGRSLYSDIITESEETNTENSEETPNEEPNSTD